MNEREPIAVFGLGYVGAVSAACFADRGHEVIGVDVNPSKVAHINDGRTPVYEELIGELISKTVGSGRLRATTNVEEAVAGSRIALICVGTPSEPNGALSTAFLRRVAADIGGELRSVPPGYLVTVRSTMLPGTCEEVLIPALEQASGAREGEGFHVAVNPEFLREGSSVRDFNDPPKTLIGQTDDASGARLERLYEGLPGPVFRVPIRVAEMAKYVDNSFHALKVGFANEIGAVCRAAGVDSHEVMDVFRSDTKLNISAAYLRPGFAFGGSCLPKDLRALLQRARRLDVALPILESVLPSNELTVQRAFDAVVRGGSRRVGMLGLAFKPGTDDLRESPMVALAERLIGRGLDVRIHDAQVAFSSLHGANLEYVQDRVPHLAERMVETPSQAVGSADAVIVASGEAEALAALDSCDHAMILDLVRPPALKGREDDPGYVGISW